MVAVFLCQPHGKHSLRSWPLTSALPSPGSCAHLGIEVVTVSSRPLKYPMKIGQWYACFSFRWLLYCDKKHKHSVLACPKVCAKIPPKEPMQICTVCFEISRETQQHLLDTEQTTLRAVHFQYLMTQHCTAGCHIFMKLRFLQFWWKDKLWYKNQSAIWN